MRHLAVQGLWAQEAIANGRFHVRRIQGKSNPVDIGTKPLSRAELEGCLETPGWYMPTCGRTST